MIEHCAIIFQRFAFCQYVDKSLIRFSFDLIGELVVDSTFVVLVFIFFMSPPNSVSILITFSSVAMIFGLEDILERINCFCHKLIILRFLRDENTRDELSG